MVGVYFSAMSVVGAAATPGNQSFPAKWADFLRSHHAGLVAAQLEQWYYSSHRPPPGGRPTALNPIPSPQNRAVAAPAPGMAHLQPPAAVPLVAQPALPQEGQWQPTGPTIGGHYGMYVAQFRADTIYTSQITSAVPGGGLVRHLPRRPRRHRRLGPGGGHEPGGGVHPDPAQPVAVRATKLYPQMQRPATRYLGPTPESRDFFSVSTS